jgi:hypothetical protein
MRTLALTALFLTATPALSQDYSAEIAATGLTATEARLTALPSPTDADRFALGGVRFLRVVEVTLQQRWAMNLNDPTGMIPFLRLPMGDNPKAAPFDPAAIAALFRGVVAGMEAARAPLDQIAGADDFGVDIALSDLWFDVNANGTRDDGEDVLSIAGPMILGWRWMGRDPATPAPVIRFDAADAAWLSAYTHLLAGVGEILLTYDPTVAITAVATSHAQFAGLRKTPVDTTEYYGMAEGIDAAYVILTALNQQPDAPRAIAARDHFLAMIAQNRTFWARVAAETDNDREWLPNDRQQSALGIDVPQGTGQVWQSVLKDAERILNGDLLVPYWRLDSAAGIDVGKMFTDPAPIDLAGWIQGTDLLPYMRKGPLATAESWGMFSQLMQGEAMLMTVFLN